MLFRKLRSKGLHDLALRVDFNYVVEHGGSAKLVSCHNGVGSVREPGSIEELIEKGKCNAVEVPHILYFCNGKLLVSRRDSNGGRALTPLEDYLGERYGINIDNEVLAVYIFDTNTTRDILLDEFSRKDTRLLYSVIEQISDMSSSIDTLTTVLEFLTAVLSLALTSGIIYFVISNGWSAKLLIFVAVIVVLAIFIARAIRRERKKRLRVKDLLWDYRARLARQFMRIAKVVAERLDGYNVARLDIGSDEARLVLLVWKKFYPYVSEHIVLGGCPQG